MGIEGIRVCVLFAWVPVCVLFAWVPVTAVEVGGGEVTVSRGPLKKSFPAVRFKSSPRCIAGAATPATTDS
ncbi:hypothetical protein E2562_030688 [Oryza meyeriana var. granulata]|uniref:Secreted protein n=1 Tax=Oryza meyeriana var. granulata TaxID=110450 RepID=A0A6G1DSH7_9ORYZ|nr:hypothetical protein E2562_030688 [Oryza meyeriana var. granulata]